MCQMRFAALLVIIITPGTNITPRLVEKVDTGFVTVL